MTLTVAEGHQLLSFFFRSSCSLPLTLLCWLSGEVTENTFLGVKKTKPVAYCGNVWSRSLAHAVVRTYARGARAPAASPLANEPPLYIRRRKLSIQYCLKLSSSPQNPTHNTVFNCKFNDLFERKPNQIPLLTIRVQPDLRTVGFVLSDFTPTYSFCSYPPFMALNGL